MLIRDDELILKLVKKQLNNLFVLNPDAMEPAIDTNLREALGSVEYCFNHINNKYFNNGTDSIFYPYHSGQYCIFLYHLAKTIWKETRNTELCSVIYYLNKILNGVDIYFEVELPGIFYVEHPVGSVMGRAKYSDYFAFYQGCTVGGNKGRYPDIGKFVTMYANSSIIGDCEIGNYVAISSGTSIKDEDIPSYSVVYGRSPDLIIKSRDQKYMEFLYRDMWKS